MSVKIQLRRDAASVWTSQNPILALGEPGFETDTNQFKIGDGTTSWTSLDYMRQDFVSVVASGLNTLSSEQSGIIKEGSLVLTESDGIRWFYKGSGEKSSAANYVPFADISPAWDQVTNRPASLLSIADLTTGSGNYVYATASNVYTTGVITDFGRSLVDDANASTARTTLGLGTLATQSGTFSGTSSGTNTGDQTAASLGLTIGTNVQAYDAGLTSIAGLTTGSGNYIYATASDVYTTGVITDFGRSLIDDVAASGARSTLGVVIGTDVQAYNATLAAVAAGTYTGTSTITSVGTLSSLTITDTTVSLAGGATTVSTATTTDLTLATNGNTSSANIIISGGVNGSISIRPIGTGNINLQSSGIALGIAGSVASIVAQGAQGLSLSANQNNSPAANIFIEGTSAHAAIRISPLGVADIRVGSGGNQANIVSIGNYGLLLAAASGTGANILINSGSSANISIRPLSGGVTLVGNGAVSNQANILANGNNGLLLGANSSVGAGGSANILIEGTSGAAAIRISPVGPGDIRVGNGGNQANIVSSGNFGLLLAAGSNTGANILISGASSNPGVNINSVGTGVVVLQGNASASNYGANIIVEGALNSSSPGNVTINSYDTGNVKISTSNIVVGTGSAQANIISTGAYNLFLAANGTNGANIIIDGTATDAKININAIGSGNVDIKAGTSGSAILSGGSGANILIDGTATNAPIVIAALGSGNITLTSTDSVLINTTDSGGGGRAVKSAHSNITGADYILNIVTISQANYDSIGSPDAHTLYVIV